jgi:integrase/recombinase XerD
MEMLRLERNTNITVQEAFERFLRIKKAQNLSPDTITHYEIHYRYFSEFFCVDQKCSVITSDTYYSYIEYLKATRKANEITLNSYLCSLRAILYFFMGEGYTERFKIKLLKTEKKIKETYNDDELASLLKKPNLKSCTFAQYRNWVMVNYFLATGNRLRTTINLKIGHLDFDNSLILMGKTKNGRQQLIPMSKSLAGILQEYLSYRKGEDEDYVFCDIRGRQLTRDGTNTIMRKHHLSLGVTKTSVHSYRHTFAKKWILNGGDIFRLQKLLGHSSMEMVKNYVEMFNEDLKQNFESFNPLDNFLKEKQGELIRMKRK